MLKQLQPFLLKRSPVVVDGHWSYSFLKSFQASESALSKRCILIVNCMAPWHNVIAPHKKLYIILFTHWEERYYSAHFFLMVKHYLKNWSRSRVVKEKNCGISWLSAYTHMETIYANEISMLRSLPQPCRSLMIVTPHVIKSVISLRLLQSLTFQPAH